MCQPPGRVGITYLKSSGANPRGENVLHNALADCASLGEADREDPAGLGDRLFYFILLQSCAAQGASFPLNCSTTRKSQFLFQITIQLPFNSRQPYRQKHQLLISSANFSGVKNPRIAVYRN